MKIVSPDILHKTEAGGVMVGAEARRRGRDGLRDDHGQRQANTRPTPRSTACRSSRCCRAAQEVIVGAVTDPSFGKLVAFGLGGVLVEVLKDITFRLAPVTTRRCAVDARRHRGGGNAERRARREPASTASALADIIASVSQLRHRLPRDRRARPQPGLRHARTARSRPTCAIVVDFAPQPRGYRPRRGGDPGAR